MKYRRVRIPRGRATFSLVEACPSPPVGLQAAEEARAEAEGRAQEAEAALEQRRAEARELEERLGKTEEESSLSKARLDSFMKAMVSLQDDRDLTLLSYKQLEEKHLQVRQWFHPHPQA